VLEAIARRGDKEVGRASLSTATGDVLIRVRPDRSEIRSDGTDLAFVELTLVDDAGSVFSDRDRDLTVELEGPAVLQCFGSANPCTVQRFTEATHSTFEGRVLAVVRPTGAGNVTLTATAPGCSPVSVALITQEADA
jgi:beta-galactosidase